MELRDWKAREGKTTAQIASLIGIGEGRIRQLQSGQVAPHMIETLAIEVMTGGDVAAGDMAKTRARYLSGKDSEGVNK